MLKCVSCSTKYPESLLKWRCPCGGYFVMESDRRTFEPELIDRGTFSQWRYRQIFPLKDDSCIITMGEGLTPLVSRKWKNREVFFKLDYLCPTGSYKDRGISFLVSKLRELGVTQITEDSSGNAGASMAAYCACGGLDCEIFVPAYTSAGKCMQIEMFGAKLKRIEGTREDTTRAAEAASDNVYYASHNWSPYFVHGIKSLAYEIWEQTAGSLPDHIVVPAGQGSLVLGLSQGFKELKIAGLVGKEPSITAVQSSNCAPLYMAWKKGLKTSVPIVKEETVAEGISSSQPVKGDAVLTAVRESGGFFVAVEDDSVWTSLFRLAREGLFVEPTSATVGAALDILIGDGSISESESVLAILTGNGLKATGKVLAHKNETGPGL